jgi:hypothetical protein
LRTTIAKEYYYVLRLAEATLHSVMAKPDNWLDTGIIVVPIPVLGYQDCCLVLESSSCCTL